MFNESTDREMRVLVVDDDEPVLEVFADMIASFGVEVATATSSSPAVPCCAKSTGAFASPAAREWFIMPATALPSIHAQLPSGAAPSITMPRRIPPRRAPDPPSPEEG